MVRWPQWVKIALTLVALVVIIPAALMSGFLFLIQPFQVRGPSMSPTLNTGDYLMVKKWSDAPQRSEIVVFLNPNDHSIDFIDRVIGLPGEKIAIRDNQVLINNQKLDEPYLKEGTKTYGGPFLGENKEVIVPEDSYFILGDNREHALDSRNWGFVKKDEIIGKYWFTYRQDPR